MKSAEGVVEVEECRTLDEGITEEEEDEEVREEALIEQDGYVSDWALGCLFRK